MKKTSMILQFKKQYNDIWREAQKLSKPQNCILCGKACNSFCNSHSVPQAVLRNITSKGKVFVAGKLLDESIFDAEKGINNSGTFRLICHDCDVKYFRDYENPTAFSVIPNDKIMAEIALKNTLLEYNKKLISYELYKNMGLSPILKTIKLDLQELKEDITVYKKIIDDNTLGVFNIIFWKDLSYMTPIASQCRIILDKDRDGGPLNDPYNFSPDIRMQPLHLSVFPYNGHTYITMFYHDNDEIYSKLKEQLSVIDLKKVLSYINWLIFQYTENFFISEAVKNIIENNEKLKQICFENNGKPNFGILDSFSESTDYKCIEEDEIPNMLEVQL
jgi:hypothetical protein